MFIGHYGVSLAAKRYAPRVPLAVLFLAVQLLDVLFAIFLLAGIEKMRIVPGFTAFNPYDLYSMPYSHSLVGALGWSVLVAIGCLVATRRLPPGARIAAAAILGAAVFSHFLLDVPMHTPDLPLAIDAGSPKIGLGLWNHRFAAIALELAALTAGGLVYLRASRPKSRGFALATVTLGVALVVLTLATPFMPDPPSTSAFAFQALGSYLILAVLAGLVGRGRQALDAPRTS
jgi:hypothetical protein